MKLIRLSLKNYRSITSTTALRIGSYTVLIGPNNEGKSNTLRGLVVGLELLQRLAGLRTPRGVPAMFYRRIYNWDRDFPVSLQEAQPNGRTEIRLTFELNEDETQEFQESIGSRLNGVLPILISVGNDGAQFQVKKQGRGGPTLSKKSKQIARYVASKLRINHIEAVRTAKSAQRVVNDLVESSMKTLEENEAYNSLLGQVQALQAPILRGMEDSIRETLREFLPDVRNVSLELSAPALRRAFRGSCELSIDDGSQTPLDAKGDGVQSLAAIALLYYAGATSGVGRAQIVVVEEPESHLHPGAIHKIREKLLRLSESQQVVVSTHSPIFANRLKPSANVIVDRRRARSASTIHEVRACLGVRASDNMQHADLVLLVEGESERRALPTLLSASSRKVADALRQQRLAVQSLAGVGNLTYHLAALRSGICRYLCFLDHDSPSISSVADAENEGLLTASELVYIRCGGHRESEFEDLFTYDSYAGVLLAKHGVTINKTIMRGAGKWSRRMGRAFETQGKTWSDDTKRDVKTQVADAVIAASTDALEPGRCTAYDSLGEHIERTL